MQLDVNYIVMVLGGVFVVVGFYIRMGNLKQVYWKSRRSMFGYIPLGLFFILAGYYNTASRQGPYIFYSYLVLFALLAGLTLFFSARPPDFIKPDWIRWIEKHPRSIQKAMLGEATENEEWKQKVVSETAVDAWAKQLARKLPRKK